MPSHIHNLDRDSMLMLYQAGELPEEDRVEVESMLLTDASLRGELEKLVAAQDAIGALITSADKKLPLPAPQISSVRKVSAAMAQWQVDRLAAKPSMQFRQPRRFAWAYAVATVAAMIVVTVFVLWSRVDDGKNDALSTWVNEQNKKVDAQDNTAVAQVPEHDPADDYTPSGGGESDTQLTRAEGDLYTLSTLTDSLRSAERPSTP